MGRLQKRCSARALRQCGAQRREKWQVAACRASLHRRARSPVGRVPGPGGPAQIPHCRYRPQCPRPASARVHAPAPQTGESPPPPQSGGQTIRGRWFLSRASTRLPHLATQRDRAVRRCTRCHCGPWCAPSSRARQCPCHGGAQIRPTPGRARAWSRSWCRPCRR
ncbi:hypothetical protein D3C71_1626740 [compost metagenome]